MTQQKTTIPLHVGKERNMTFPKDLVNKLELSSDELAGSMLVINLKKIVTGKGRVIESEELDRLLGNKNNGK